MFSFLSNCRTVFHDGCSILRSHRQCMRNRVSPHPCQHLFSKGCEVVFYCAFDLHFPSNNGAIFSCAYGPFLVVDYTTK